MPAAPLGARAVWLALGALVLAACTPEELAAPPAEAPREVLGQELGIITPAAVNPTADSNIVSTKPTFNAGAGSKIAVGGGDRRGLIRFGTLPTQPSNSTVTGVTLTMTIVSTSGSAQPTLSLYQLSQSWSEGTTAVNYGGTSPDGADCGAGGGGVTWNTRNCSTGWTTAGGTNSGFSGSAVVSAGVISWVDGGLIDDVKDWYANGFTNNGWLIVSSNTAAGSGRAFYSRTGAVPPTLTVSFTCNAGYVQSGSTCVNYDACAAGGNASCRNGVGGSTCTDDLPPSLGYSCSCGTGQVLAAGPSCADIDGCAGADPCDTGGDNGTCSDVAAGGTGNTCTCNAGYQSSGSNPTTCANINECLVAGTCSNGSCTNRTGANPGYTCSCNAGFQSSGGNFPVCNNINECVVNPTICTNGGSCTNNSGNTAGYTCSCPPGYASSGGSFPTCGNINECLATPCGAGGTGGSDGLGCTESTPGNGWSCSCGAGYQTTGGANPTCANINECLTTPCGVGGVGGTGGNGCSESTPGNGWTCSCAAGYQSTGGANPTCANINECLATPCGVGGVGGTGGNGCSENAPGSGWACNCSAGYQSTGGASPTCQNFDACAAGGTTSCVATQAGNLCNDGSPPSTGYGCTCGNAAYTDGPGNTSCVNFDACVGEPCDNGGDASGTCTDVAAPGTGYTCSCGPGFVSNGTTCVDLNECTANPTRCAFGGACTNIPNGGGYSCACATGYSVDPASQPFATVCVLANECTDGTNDCSANANCINEDPGFTCACKTGYQDNNPGTPGRNCTDIDECTANTDLCDVGGCTNTAGSYTCTCPAGYTGTGTTACNNVNECLSSPCGPGSCADTQGSYTCACNTGYSNSGGVPTGTCVEIDGCLADPCHIGTGLGTGCADVPAPGLGNTCTCSTGYSPSGTNPQTCADTNGCLNNPCDNLGDLSAGCGDIAAPLTGNTCTCSAGYVATGNNPTVCDNVNECLGNPCDAEGDVGGFCTELAPGSGYTCTCTTGYASTGGPAPVCRDFDACNAAAQTACVSAQAGNSCVDNGPPSVGYTCTCGNPAYTTGAGNQSCVNFDACTVDLCNSNGDGSASCTDRAAPTAGYDCTCSAGYDNDNATNESCVNHNECLDAPNPCAPGNCTDSTGSYSCACPAGYNSTGTACVDQNECAGPGNPCAPGTCTNTPGTYSCGCPAGYTGSGTTACNDVDECNPVNPCGVGTCSNNAGSYACTCPAGSYENQGGVPTGTCVDVDECAVGTDTCSADADCTNTTGGFTCKCKTGYGGDGFVCSNLFECDTGIDTCDDDAICEDTIGSYTCTCKPGFENVPGGTGHGTDCVDVDECTVPSHNCDVHATCGNTAGSFTCTCNAPGYTGTGTACTDVDECAANSDDCDTNATCTNTDGAYTCACNPGYHDITGGTGHTNQCDDDDECSLGGTKCDLHADCRNTAGQYACDCWTTYTGNGVTCIDRNECAGTNPCTGGRVCENLTPLNKTDPGFSCACPGGQSAVDATAPCQVVCGDGVLDASEGCEGNVDGCTGCQVDRGWVCTFDPDVGVSECSNNCPDGFVDPGEECDDGPANSNTQPDACRSDCRLAYCGDGVIDPSNSEECDDGAANSSAPDVCRPDCRLARCGDGTRDSNEGCDDGDTTAGDGCSASCMVEDQVVCTQHDGGPDTCTMITPDAGVLDAGMPMPGADGGGDSVDAGPGIPPYAPDTKSSTVAGCSLSPRTETSHGWLLLFSLLGSTWLVRRRRERIVRGGR